MALDSVKYVPTLAIRASEMNGLEFLPGATKDRIIPCVLLAPWANSHSLDRAIDRVQQAFPNRNYFLDIDRDYQCTNSDSPPQRELMRLLDPADNFSNWLKFIEAHEWVWPCIQSRDQDKSEIQKQIEAVQKVGRRYCLRIARERFPSNIEETVSAFATSGAADFVVILEGGWTRDPLSLAAWFEGIISGSLQEIGASVPIVLSCTSMPKVFSAYSGITSVPFNNRVLVDQVSRRTNRRSTVYGDWGSTRPREVVGFRGRPLDRIDYPTRDSWIIVRDKGENWNFKTAAGELVNSDCWNGNLNIWGERLIYDTTINEEVGINTPQKNVAARVNVHLHLQAFYGKKDLGELNFDEDWVD